MAEFEIHMSTMHHLISYTAVGFVYRTVRSLHDNRCEWMRSHGCCCCCWIIVPNDSFGRGHSHWHTSTIYSIIQNDCVYYGNCHTTIKTCDSGVHHIAYIHTEWGECKEKRERACSAKRNVHQKCNMTLYDCDVKQPNKQWHRKYACVYVHLMLGNPERPFVLYKVILFNCCKRNHHVFLQYQHQRMTKMEMKR